MGFRVWGVAVVAEESRAGVCDPIQELGVASHPSRPLASLVVPPQPPRVHSFRV